MRSKNNLDNRLEKGFRVDSLNKVTRKQELMKITMENQQILRRIQSREPEYNHVKWDIEYEKNEKIMKGLMFHKGAMDGSPMGKTPRTARSHRGGAGGGTYRSSRGNVDDSFEQMLLEEEEEDRLRLERLKQEKQAKEKRQSSQSLSSSGQQSSTPAQPLEPAKVPEEVPSAQREENQPVVEIKNEVAQPTESGGEGGNGEEAEVEKDAEKEAETENNLTTEANAEPTTESKAEEDTVATAEKEGDAVDADANADANAAVTEG